MTLNKFIVNIKFVVFFNPILTNRFNICINYFFEFSYFYVFITIYNERIHIINQIKELIKSFTHIEYCICTL